VVNFYLHFGKYTKFVVILHDNLIHVVKSQQNHDSETRTTFLRFLKCRFRKT